MGNITEEKLKELLGKIQNLNYQELSAKLEELQKKIDEFYTPEKDGQYPVLDKKKQQMLLIAYANTADAVQKVLKQKDISKPVAKIAECLKNLLSKDITAIISVKPEEKKTLPEMLNQARTIRVSAKREELESNKVGDMWSTRHPLKVVIDGKEVQGFFTAEEKIQSFSASEAKKILQNIKSRDAELRKMLGGGMEKDLIAFFGKLDKKFFNLDNLNEEQKMNYEVYKTPAIAVTPPELRNIIYQLQKHQEWNVFEKKWDSSSLYVKMGATKNSTITGRNIAMSRISRLLGLNDILAESRTMEVEDEQGNIIKGVFMEKAEGIDKKDMTADTVKNLDKNAPFSPSCLKQAADLQILDFICQNLDRHTKNMFYRFSKDGSKIEGIQGIDNDMSFGRLKKGGERAYGKNDISLNGLQVISKELWETLDNLTPEAFTYCLKDVGLSDKEIEGVTKRFGMVKNNIRVCILKKEDSEWKDLKLDDLAKKQASIFYKLKEGGIQNISSKVSDNGDKKITYTDAAIINGIDKHTLEMNFNKAAALAQRIKTSQSKIHGESSDEFTKLEVCVNKYLNAVSTAEKNTNQKTEYEIEQALIDMEDAAKAYLSKKGNSSIYKNTRERIKIAKDVKEFANLKYEESETYKKRRNEEDRLQLNQKLREVSRGTGNIKSL